MTLGPTSRDVVGRPAGVDCLLEHGDAGLGPQTAAEQQRRVGRAGEHRTGEQLGDVVLVGERRRVDLEVNLEAGVARLDHHRVVAYAQLVDALDVEVDVGATQVADRRVESVVAVLVDHVRQTEVGRADGRQDPGQQHVDAALVGDGSHPAEELVQLRLHGAEAVATEALRIEVELEIEGTDLGHQVRVVDGVEDLERDRRRLPVAVDEEHLLLGADAAHTGLDAPFGEHAVEGMHFAQQSVGEPPAVLSASTRFSHVLPPGPSHRDGSSHTI